MLSRIYSYIISKPRSPVSWALLRTMMELELLKNPTTIHCDNQSSIVLAKNPVVYQKLKHIDIKLQFIHDEINKGSILLEYIETEKNVADMFTKPMTGIKLNIFRKFIVGNWFLTLVKNSPVDWGRRIHLLHLSRGVKLPQTSVQDMTINQSANPIYGSNRFENYLHLIGLCEKKIWADMPLKSIDPSLRFVTFAKY